jgi:hypothetical protein
MENSGYFGGQVKNNREEAREGSGELVMFSILIWKVIL